MTLATGTYAGILIGVRKHTQEHNLVAVFPQIQCKDSWKLTLLLMSTLWAPFSLIIQSSYQKILLMFQ